jgi:predicted GIY-YIG superfamily endonuclease
MIYLLHFSRPICPTRPTRHYIGWTNDLDVRIREHRRGKGSRLCQVAQQRGITFKLAEVWHGDRQLERRLKNYKNSPKLCPICQR